MRTQSATIGYTVRVRRAEENLTQEELAQSSGCSRQTIRGIENELQSPGHMLAWILSKRLGFSLDAVLPNPPPPNACVCHLYGPEQCAVCFPPLGRR